MTTEDMIRALGNVIEEYKNKPVFTGQTDIPMMCMDVIGKLKELSNPWHTGTPTVDGFYLCKVHYGDIPDDMRILEWVGDMGCFCLPESKIRGYHFYVGDEGVEVVYEWQRLTMRFRKEHGGWLEP